MSAKLLVRAYVNEIALDKRFKELYGSSYRREISSLPNFKVMKQIVFRERLGNMYQMMIISLQIMIPVYILTKIFYSFLIILFGKRKFELQETIIIPTTDGNITLIESVIEKPSHVVNISIGELSRYLSMRDIFTCFGEIVALYSIIFSRKKKSRRRELLLHSHDCLELLLFMRFLRRNNQNRYITDDHYQRWAYILSYLTNDFSIVQHGFLDPEIIFPNQFGKVNCIHIRNDIFKKDFTRYYKCNKFEEYKRDLLFTLVNNTKYCIFFASSYPRVDEEIETLKIIKSKTSLPILIKLHPHHEYSKEKKSELLSFASYICAISEFPVCSIFVSYNSYLEFAYIDTQTFTYSIKRDNISKLLIELQSK